jgi:2',3'-cyclic-nucleotide 2'-phosphodiesterase/3'-nucleotidase
MLGVAALALVAGNADAARASLPIAETTDSHKNLLDYDCYQDKGTDQFGLARAEARNSLFVDNADLLQGNPMGDLVARVQPLAQRVVHRADKVIERTTPIHSHFAQVADAPSVQVVSPAQIAYVRATVQGTDYETYPILSAAAPFKAGGRQGWGDYIDIPVGPVPIRNVADLYMYPSTLKAVLIPGAEVHEWLELSAGQFRRIDPQGPADRPLINDDFRSYNVDVIDGVTDAIDVTEPAKYDPNGKPAKPEANRIKTLAFDGRPIDDTAKFIVVTDNYRTYGGGNLPGIDAGKVVIDAPAESREALVRYFAANPIVNPAADSNWRIHPVAGVSLRFLSGAGAIGHLAADPSIRLMRDNGDGPALFELAR